MCVFLRNNPNKKCENTRKKRAAIVKSKQQIWMDGQACIINGEFYLNVRRRNHPSQSSHNCATSPLKTLWEIFTIFVKTTRITNKMHYHFFSARSFCRFADFAKNAAILFSFCSTLTFMTNEWVELSWVRARFCFCYFKHLYLLHWYGLPCIIVYGQPCFVDANISTDTVFLHLIFFHLVRRRFSLEILPFCSMQ